MLDLLPEGWPGVSRKLRDAIGKLNFFSSNYSYSILCKHSDGHVANGDAKQDSDNSSEESVRNRKENRILKRIRSKFKR